MSLAGFTTLDVHAVDADLGGVILPVADLCDLVNGRLSCSSDASSCAGRRTWRAPITLCASHQPDW